MKHAWSVVWRWIKWPLLVLVVLYAIDVAWVLWYKNNEAKTNEAVAAIHAKKITLADVMGKALPPTPDQTESDATVAGIDQNNNGVRDDVELAIFKKYPNSPKIRAAELQYAMALQLMLTKVTNTETWKAAAVETSRGAACIGETHAREHLQEYIRVTRERSEEVRRFVINNQIREDAKDKAYNFTTSYALPDLDLCNVVLDTL